MNEPAESMGQRQSMLHRLPPMDKLLIALSVVVVSVSLPPDLWPVHGVLAAIVFAGHSLANIPLSYLLRRLAIFMPVVAVFAISIPAAHAFATGWDLMAGIVVRSTVSFLTLLWLVHVLPFDQLLSSLRRLYVPELLIAMLAFMYRYVYVLWDELSRMRTARKARTFGHGNRWLAWRSSAQLIGMVLIRAMSRAERIHDAMLARGWDGRVRTMADAPETVFASEESSTGGGVPL